MGLDPCLQTCPPQDISPRRVRKATCCCSLGDIASESLVRSRGETWHVRKRQEESSNGSCVRPANSIACLAGGNCRCISLQRIRFVASILTTVVSDLQVERGAKAALRWKSPSSRRCFARYLSSSCLSSTRPTHAFSFGPCS